MHRKDLFIAARGGNLCHPEGRMMMIKAEAKVSQKKNRRVTFAYHAWSGGGGKWKPNLHTSHDACTLAG